MSDDFKSSVPDCAIQLCVARRLQQLPALAGEILNLKMDHYHNRESLDPDTFSAEVDDVFGQLLEIKWPTHMNEMSGTFYRIPVDGLAFSEELIAVSRREFAEHALGPLMEYVDVEPN